MPDIDTDFCQRNRARIIRYAQVKYGIECVGQIITLGSLHEKTAIRDVGRCLGISADVVNKFSKQVSFDEDGLKIKKTKMIKAETTDASTLNKLVETTMKILGVYKLISTHAAGIVINNTCLKVQVPTT